MFDPGRDELEPARVNPADPRSSNFFACDQSALFQDLDVLHDGGEREVERAGKLTDICGPVGEAFDDCPSGRFRECAETIVDR